MTGHTIHNCHTHIFTAAHVPDQVLPLGAMGWLQNEDSAKRLRTVLRFIDPAASFLHRIIGDPSRAGMLSRFGSMLELSDCKTQGEIFERLSLQYPSGTKFVALSIDMDYMGAGVAQKPFLEQIAELAKLKAELKKDGKDTLIPFIGVDPRRPKILELVKEYIEEHQFGGLKLYPSLGFFPGDQRLYPVYEYAIAKNLPIITHCSKGGLWFRGKRQHEVNLEGEAIFGKNDLEFAQNYTSPQAYKTLLKDFKSLKLCFAHFGGDSEWKTYLRDHQRHLPPVKQSWGAQIMNLMYDYPNVWADISYTAAYRDLHPLIKVLINDPKIGERILFGTDYFVVRAESSEREFSIRLRGALGEGDFWKIAFLNPSQFL
jgi:uncharacterized protein